MVIFIDYTLTLNRFLKITQCLTSFYIMDFYLCFVGIVITLNNFCFVYVMHTVDAYEDLIEGIRKQEDH